MQVSSGHGREWIFIQEDIAQYKHEWIDSNDMKKRKGKIEEVKNIMEKVKPYDFLKEENNKDVKHTVSWIYENSEITNHSMVIW